MTLVYYPSFHRLCDVAGCDREPLADAVALNGWRVRPFARDADCVELEVWRPGHQEPLTTRFSKDVLIAAEPQWRFCSELVPAKTNDEATQLAHRLEDLRRSEYRLLYAAGKLWLQAQPTADRAAPDAAWRTSFLVAQLEKE